MLLSLFPRPVGATALANATDLGKAIWGVVSWLWQGIGERGKASLRKQKQEKEMLQREGVGFCFSQKHAAL